MDALDKLIAITSKLQNLPDGEEKTKLLEEAKKLMTPAQEEVELSEKLLRIEMEHKFNIQSED